MQKRPLRRRLASLACASFVAFAGGGAFASDLSDPAFVHLTPETSSFWHTATNATLTVPIDFPFGATSASLAVRGTRYSKDYEDIRDGAFTLSLPSAPDMTKEDVYELTLTFDNGQIETARLGLVFGLDAGPCGATRCLREKTGVWTQSQGNGVLPVPQGTTSLSVGGVAVAAGDKGFTGAQGWHALGRLKGGKSVDLVLTTDEGTFSVSGVTRALAGTIVIVR